MNLREIKTAQKAMLDLQNKNKKNYAAILKINRETKLLETNSIKERVEDRLLTRNAAWGKLSKLVSARLKKVEKLLKNIDKVSVDRNGTLLKLNEKINAIAIHNVQLDEMENWTLIKAEIKRRLKEENYSTAQINTLIQRLERFDFKKFTEDFNNTEKKRGELIVNLFNQLLGHFIKEYYTNCCIQTSIHFKKNQHYTIRRNSIQAIEKRMNNYYKEIKKIILKKDTDKLEKFCRTSIEDIQEYIDKTLLPSAAALLRKEATNRKTFDDILDLSVKIGTLIRESILLLAFIKRVDFYVKNNTIHTEMPGYQKAALLNLTSEGTKASAVSFKSLAVKGEDHDQKEIRIKGRVMKIVITHIYKKPISTVYITDGVYIVAAVIPHIKIDSTGLVRNTYVEMTGVWNENNKEAKDKPALMIDRIDHTTRAKTNWHSWLALEMNDVFEVMPHSVNANLSWKQGRNGAINPIKYSPLKIN